MAFDDRRGWILWAALIACGPAVDDADDMSEDDEAAEDGDEDAAGDRGGQPGGDRGGREDAGEKEDAGGDAGDAGGDAGEDKGDDDGREDPKGGEELRTCYECWGEFESVCAAELGACKDNLACTQLQECPLACGYGLECVAECNEIIPSGVPPLTDLLECMVCGADAPCADECDNDVMLSYCG